MGMVFQKDVKLSFPLVKSVTFKLCENSFFAAFPAQASYHSTRLCIIITHRTVTKEFHSFPKIRSWIFKQRESGVLVQFCVSDDEILIK